MKKLSHDLQLALKIFNNATNNIVSTIDFRLGGIFYPAQVIRRMRGAGAIISVVKKLAYNELDELRPNIAHYRLESWV